MSLSELMSSYGLAFFPQMALIVFLVVFLVVVARVILAPKSEMKHDAALALDDGAQNLDSPIASEESRQ